MHLAWPVSRVGRLLGSRRVFTTTDEDEPAVAILALDEILVAHLVPDLGMAHGAPAPIAGDLRLVTIEISGGVKTSRLRGMVKLRLG